MHKNKTILWWGRYSPGYSRNRIFRNILHSLGYNLVDFRPKVTSLATLEAFFYHFPKIHAVWVPAFRHRDFKSAKKFALTRGVPIIFDPLISAWDKVVFERKKYNINHRAALRLHKWESSIYSQTDLLLADTVPHARFFIDEFHASNSTTLVVPVGAEESFFQQQQPATSQTQPEILFYGSFINLQGPEIIVEAAALVPEVKWTLLGRGPLRARCEQKACGLPNVSFEEPVAYKNLATRIGKADILLGVFGNSAKAGRVIANKVYQSMACGRPVITQPSPAYPEDVIHDPRSGLFFTPPGDPVALADCVRRLLADKQNLVDAGKQARRTYEIYFSNQQIADALKKALEVLFS
ncbi:MAG: glycosyltransferase [Desulfobulbus sp.]|nr:glycosyltransferase [Desulfobulbus sp.]